MYNIESAKRTYAEYNCPVPPVMLDLICKKIDMAARCGQKCLIITTDELSEIPFRGTWDMMLSAIRSEFFSRGFDAAVGFSSISFKGWE